MELIQSLGPSLSTVFLLFGVLTLSASAAVVILISDY
jgi:hypothetical protein